MPQVRPPRASLRSGIARVTLGALALLAVAGAPAGAVPLLAPEGPRLDKVKPLKEAWHAPALAGEVITLPSERGLTLVGLEPNESGARSVVRFNPQDGAVIWRAPPPAGVVWTAMVAGDDGIALTGQRLDDPAGATELALLAVRDGRQVWSRSAKAGERLRVGADGGLVIEQDCGIEVVGSKSGETWEVIPGRVDAVSTPAAEGEERRSLLCTARPRLLGQVAGAAVVLAPSLSGTGWRMFALSGPRHVWDVGLGPLDAAPDVDWRTSVLWSNGADGLRIQRWDLTRGTRAWEQIFDTRGCRWQVRGFDLRGDPPGLLVQACDRLSGLEPHAGTRLWEVSFNGDVPLVIGERPELPEPVQPGSRDITVGWVDPAGRVVGAEVVPPETMATPLSTRLLTRGPDALTLRSTDVLPGWSLPVAATDWRLFSDTVVARVGVAVGSVPTGAQIVVDLDTGAIFGQIGADEIPVAVVPAPGSATQRLLVLGGAGVRAVRLGPSLHVEFGG